MFELQNTSTTEVKIKARGTVNYFLRNLTSVRFLKLGLSCTCSQQLRIVSTYVAMKMFTITPKVDIQQHILLHILLIF